MSHLTRVRLVSAMLLAAVPDVAAPAQNEVARGRYLVTISGCHDCHTPKKMGPHGPVPDTSRMLSGAPEDANLPAPPRLPPGPWMATASWDLTAWSGPWGISYAFNLTPDELTGIGSWSKETFVKALRTGRHMGVARPILPPMPWQMYREMTDEDLGAVYAYLRSIPAIRNRVPEPVIHEPARGVGNTSRICCQPAASRGLVESGPRARHPRFASRYVGAGGSVGLARAKRSGLRAPRPRPRPNPVLRRLVVAAAPAAVAVLAERQAAKDAALPVRRAAVR